MRREYRSVTSGGDAGNDLTRLTWIPLRGFFGLLSGASAGKEEDHVVIVFVTRVLVQLVRGLRIVASAVDVGLGTPSRQSRFNPCANSPTESLPALSHDDASTDDPPSSSLRDLLRIRVVVMRQPDDHAMSRGALASALASAPFDVSQQFLANLVGTSASPGGAGLGENPHCRDTGALGEHPSRIQFEPQTKVADRDMCTIVGIDTHHVGTPIQTPHVA